MCVCVCVCLAISLFLKKLGANLKFNIIKLKMFICVFFNQKKKKKKRKGLSVLNDETYKFLRGLRFYRDMKIFRVSNQMTNQ